MPCGLFKQSLTLAFLSGLPYTPLTVSKQLAGGIDSPDTKAQTEPRHPCDSRLLFCARLVVHFYGRLRAGEPQGSPVP